MSPGQEMGRAGPKRDALVGRKKALNESTISLARGKGFLSSPLEVAGEMCPRAKTITPRHIWILDYSYTLLMVQALSSTEL